MTSAPPSAARGPATAAAASLTGAIVSIAAADLDRDGDLDLVLSGPDSLARIDNAGGNANAWLDVRLRGLAQGNDRRTTGSASVPPSR